MIISPKKIAQAKVKKLKDGYSAFAETEKVAALIRKQLKKLDIYVIVDKTDHGYWFIPHNSGKGTIGITSGSASSG
ncbi:hypothetical protein [Thermoactinomyces mirandus]|uniref:Uncharacterized protein n=1 Tax=Thermoactinomyces mirandus TaxID=2756294 RepID=A0A7W1XQV3_9BACL|nr:hypothetical protein [Thermoactinomyces mirandus]MBA4601588.1 hypothetical protein [Thermoactinomyces mirandus]